MHNYGQQLGQNCPFGPKEDFLQHFTVLSFIYLLCPIKEQSLKKKILRLGPEIKASIILSHNWAVIGHLVQKGIFLEISLKWFFSTYCFQSCCKIWKKSLIQILEYKTACFWATIGLNLPTWTRRGFSGKFT